MALKAVLDNLDGLDEGLAGLYTETDGRFVLAVEPVDGFALENVSGLKSSLAKERANAKTLASQMSAFGDIDADDARSALDKVGEMSTWTPDDKVREQIAAREKQLVTKHKQELEKVGGELGGVRGQLENQLIRNAAVEAIRQNGGNVDLLLPHIEKSTRLENVDGKYVAQVVDDNGTPRVSMKPGSVDGMTIEELVVSLRDSDAYSPAFAGSGATGSGSAGSSAAGSGTSGKWNLSWDEAHDPATYRAAKEAAENAGSTVSVQPFDQ